MKIVRFSLALIALLTAFAASAKIVPTYTSIYTPVGGSAVIVGNPTAEANPVVAGSLGGTYVDRFTKDVITFGVNHHYPVYFTSMRVEIRVAIQAWDNAPATGGADLVDTIDMTVSYSPEDSLTFNDKESYILEDYQEYKVKIIGIKVNGSTVTTLPANLYLNADIYVDRYYDFSTPAATPLTIAPIDTLDSDCDGRFDQLVLQWNSLPSAEEYQLEWVYINDYKPNGGYYTASELAYDFKRNSTRISTAERNYALTLAYDRGFIVYRVRAIGRATTDLDQRIFGVWSEADNGAVNTADRFHKTYSWQDSLNWQYSSTFAEEGKKKEVVSFFDGSLRNRQMVTRINSDNNTVVGETIYDHQGRPAIQVLPTPVQDLDCSEEDKATSLKYYHNFTQNQDGDPYNRLDFDTSAVLDPCSATADTMGLGNGAARYYSPDNPNLLDENAFIPDAKGFPFSQVEYTPDNTGRIRRQGGVGEEFQLGSGHETKYFYGHPEQIQLDRMFGSEVGDYSHYQKNMVVDPNGQISVSYLDQEGRVIATSLAGENPENLIGLPSEAAGAIELTSDLLGNDSDTNSTTNELTAAGNEILLSQTILVAGTTEMTFTYDLDTEPFTDPCLEEDICFSCIYDLTIKVIDECGTDLVEAADTIIPTKIGKFTMVEDSLEFDCDSIANWDFPETSFTLTLPTGSYQVVKSLKINEAAKQAYIAAYLDSVNQINSCLKTLGDFEAEYLAGTNFEDCYSEYNCDSCLAHLGTLEDFLAIGGTAAQYQARQDECNQLCNEISPCEAAKIMLIGDMTPGGQYAYYENPDGTDNIYASVLSYLNPNNILPHSMVNPSATIWREPKIWIDGGFINEYREDDGVTPAKVPLQVTFSGGSISSTTPGVQGTATLGVNVFQDGNGQYYTRPELLATAEEFIAAFQSSWANSLLAYHPEFSFYQSCLDFGEKVETDDPMTSDDFDNLLRSIDTWEGAVTAGLIKDDWDTYTNVNDRVTDWFSDTDPDVPWDPFVVHAATYNNYGLTLAGQLNFYTELSSTTYSMMEMAALGTRCPNLMGAIPDASCLKFGDDVNLLGPLNQENIDARNNDWRNLRSFYLSAKQHQQQLMAVYRSINTSSYLGYNGCIGDIDFNKWQYDFLSTPLSASEYVNPGQPCYVGTYEYYAERTKRFPFVLDVIDTDVGNAAYQQYLLTGQCPLTSTLQSLLSQVASLDSLDEASFIVSELGAFGGFYLALNDYYLSAPVPEFEWDQTSLSSTLMTADLVETATSTVLGSVSLEIPSGASYTWDDILSFSGMQYTTGAYEFEVQALVNDGGTTSVVTLTGETTFDIETCRFNEVCERNDLGNDLFALAGVLVGEGDFHSTTAVQLQGGSSDYEPLISTDIQLAAENGPTTALYWKFNSATPAFEIYETSPSTLLWELKILGKEPSTFSLANLNLVAAITDLVPTQGNTFDLVCEDASGDHLVTLKCLSYRHDPTVPEKWGVPLGGCDLPTSPFCDGASYGNLEDLEALLEDVILNQSMSGDGYDLYASAQLTDELETYFGYSTTETESSTSNFNGTDFHSETTTITTSDTTVCPLVLQVTDDESPLLSLSQVIGLGYPATTGEANELGEYSSFYLLAAFDTGSDTIVDTIFVSGCLPVNTCSSCPEEIELFEEEELMLFLTPTGPPIIKNPVISSECRGLYDEYLAAWSYFNSVQAGLSPGARCRIYGSSPISLGTFMSYQFCCSDYGNEFMTDYIAMLYAGTECPFGLFDLNTCSLPDEDTTDCHDLWEDFQNAIDAYNGSDWAGSNNVSMEGFPTFEVFVAAGGCRCAEAYVTYLQTWILADKTDELPFPEPFYCEPLEDTLVPEEDPCAEAYDQYLDCIGSFNEWASTNEQETIDTWYTFTEFTDLDLCSCVDLLCSVLSDGMNGLADLTELGLEDISKVDIYDLCNAETTPPCVPELPIQTNIEFPVAEFADPCTEFLTSIAYANAYDDWQDYMDSVSGAIGLAYTTHCLEATESFTRVYDDKEYHRTLYYYDQAGNLIKTIPPEGVELLNLTSDFSPLADSLDDDRANGTHYVLTSHRMETKYRYNSLNQLTHQVMPDQDPAEVWEITLPNGLYAGLNTTAIQMVSSTRGYLTGNIQLSSGVKRGFLYRTDNGGDNWTRVNNTVAAQLKRIEMVSSTIGFAVGEAGIALQTIDGGISWDLINLYSPLGVTGTLNDLVVTSSTAVRFVGEGATIVNVSLSGSVATPTTGTLVSPVGGTTIVRVHSVSYDGSDYYYAVTLNDGTDDYDAILSGSSLSPALNTIRGTDYRAIHYYSATEGYAFGEDGDLVHLTTPASGSAFVQTQQRSSITDTPKQVYFLNADRGVGLFERGGQTLGFFTTDAGENWQPLDELDGMNYLSLVKQDATTLELLAVGDAAATKRIFWNTITGAPNALDITYAQNPQAYDLTTATLVKDANGPTFVIAGASDGKVYRSNDLPTGTEQVTYTLVDEANGSTTADVAQKIAVYRYNTGAISGIILTDAGTLYSLHANAGGTLGVATMTLSGGGTPDFRDLTLDVTDKRVYAIDNTANKLHKMDLSATAHVTSTAAYSTALSPNYGMHAIATSSGRITVSGERGFIWTTNDLSGANTFSGWGQREALRSIRIHELQVNSSSDGVAVGENGLILYGSGITWSVKPYGALEELYAVKTVGAKELVVGANGYAMQMEGLVAPSPLMTNNGMTITAQLPDVDLHDIAADGDHTYLVGTNGTVLYSPDPAATAFAVTTGTYGADFYAAAISTGQSGTPKALAGGDHAKIFRFQSVSGNQQKNVFAGDFADVHFADLNTGTLAGKDYFVRQTTDGGESWNIVLPGNAVSTQLGADIIAVWTLPGGYALLGGVSYGATVENGISTNVTFPFTTTDIGAAAGNPLKVYTVTTSGDLFRTVFAPSGASYTRTDSYLTAGNQAPSELHGLHVFDNGNVMVAGDAGYVGMWEATALSPDWTDHSPGGDYTTAVFNDVFFHDDVVGYVVGDDGVFLRSENVTIHPISHAITALSWDWRDPRDRIVTDTLEIDIKAISFGSRYNGVWGGSYDDTELLPVDQQHTAYVRSVNDESGDFSARFFYDRLGRIVVSQNSRQYAADEYSYTLYDALGRVYEAGVKAENPDNGDPVFAEIFGAEVGGVLIPSVIDDEKLEEWLTEDAALTRTEVTRSYYDGTVITGLPVSFVPDELTQRKRITHVTYEAAYDANDQTFDHATHYDYDIHGNVKTLLQDNRKMSLIDANIADQRFKRIDYTYDLVSGNVHRVDYETGNADQWHQAYRYDADNRITDAYSTETTPLLEGQYGDVAAHSEMDATPYWDKEAFYKYYQHGPLARTELGELKVQGLDYVYTLQGWLKGVNSNTLNDLRDPGNDAFLGAVNSLAARDAYGYSLHYFATDYDQISGANAFVADQSSSDLVSFADLDLYNGNIARMITTITNPNTRDVLPLGNLYAYDQLNRLNANLTFDNLDQGSNSWGSGGTVLYTNNFNYDANGNITYQLRTDHTNTIIDELSYSYEQVGGKTFRNRLTDVSDGVAAFVFPDDIDGMSPNNYRYDQEGRLVQDVQEKIDTILWRVDGKVAFIEMDDASGKNNLRFDYDAMGHRIAKHVYTDADVLEHSTYYILDAQGNVISVYEHAVDEEEESTTYYQAEKHIYGSARLGVLNDSIPLLGTENDTYDMTLTDHIIGKRVYELSNHLGNVLSTVSDKVIPMERPENEPLYENDFSSTYSPLSPYLVAGGASLSSGKLLVDDCNQWGSVSMTLPTEPGATYTIAFDSDPTTGGPLVAFTHDPTTHMNLTYIYAPSNTSYNYSFTATGTTTLIIWQSEDIVQRDFYLDNVVIERDLGEEALYFLADIRTSQDYSPFGVTLEGRNFVLSGAEKSRYGFQGQEADDEIKGEGNSYNYEFRMHDSRLGRFFETDPLASKYSYNSPYAFSENNVIACYELEGLQNENGIFGKASAIIGSVGTTAGIGSVFIPPVNTFLREQLSGEYSSSNFKTTASATTYLFALGCGITGSFAIDGSFKGYGFAGFALATITSALVFKGIATIMDPIIKRRIDEHYLTEWNANEVAKSTNENAYYKSNSRLFSLDDQIRSSQSQLNSLTDQYREAQDNLLRKEELDGDIRKLEIEINSYILQGAADKVQSSQDQLKIMKNEYNSIATTYDDYNKLGSDLKIGQEKLNQLKNDKVEEVKLNVQYQNNYETAEKTRQQIIDNAWKKKWKR